MNSSTDLNSKVNVREARPEEITLIRDFQVAMAWESEKLRLDPETCLRGVSQIFVDPGLGNYFMIEGLRPTALDLPPDEHPQIVGCLLLQREWSDWRARSVLWIHSLYLEPPFRGQGLYRATYRYFQDRVRSDPTLGGLRLYVDRKNPTAIAVYEKLGMTREHYHLYEWMK